MGIKLSNNANATLAASITSSATSITVTSGQGARFPTLSAGDYFYATLVDTSNNLEIVKCTARSTDVLTVTRAQESTTARAYSAGDRIEIRLTAQTFVDATTITPAMVSDQANTSTGAFDVPTGTTAQRPASPTTGYIRYNTTLEQLEMYDGVAWISVRRSFSATGGTTVDAGGFRYHTFTSSGTFQITKGTTTVEYLIVAGGGGGGFDVGGGGGAGGVVGGSASLGVASYSVTVGAGGAGAAAVSGNQASDGAASSFNSVTATGGGGAGSWQGANGRSGGSGGGGGGSNTLSAGSGGAGTAGQGFAGGNGTKNGYTGNNGMGGGGGGAGAAGGVASGGVGTSAYSTWGLATTTGQNVSGVVYYAGGGATADDGGGSAGTPGYGGGAATQANGTANTGGGGGGSGATSTQGSGGSGIVIIRYAL